MKDIGIQVRPYFRSKQTQTSMLKVIHTSSSLIKSIVMNIATSPIKPSKMPMKDVSKVVLPSDDTSDADTSTSYYIPGTTSQSSDTAAAVIEEYSAIALKHRERIVACANRGEDWVLFATTLGIKYKTAFHYVRSGRDVMLKKGGIKLKHLLRMK
nr:unnamed protein product [Callosobruchus analis]